MQPCVDAKRSAKPLPLDLDTALPQVGKPTQLSSRLLLCCFAYRKMIFRHWVLAHMHSHLQETDSAAPSSNILYSSMNDLYTDSTRRKLLASGVGHLTRPCLVNFQLSA